MSMLTHQKDGVEYLTFESFDRTGLCRHGFSTRIGGVSEGGCATLNLRFGSNDDPSRVMENYRLFCDALGIGLSDLVLSRQVHGIHIHEAVEANKGFDVNIGKADGLMTDQTGIALVTAYADCVPLLFLDVKRKVIGSAHAGWKGTQANIAGHTLRRMRERYGCRGEDILAGIGPSIGPCCFEVDTPVADAFHKAFGPTAYIAPAPGGKYRIDLWALNRQCMIEAGIPPENITIAGECTKCNPGKYFSHRTSGTDRGGMAAVLQLI